MRSVVIGIHLQREDVEPVATAMAAGDLFASTFAVGEDRPLADRDLLLEIAEVRARLLDRATFIAVRYGFTVHDERELAAKCAGMTDRWRKVLTMHRDEFEMTLKAPVPAPPARPDRRDFTTGAAYLRALHETASAMDLDPALRVDVEQRLIPLATAHRWVRESSAVELAMLVRRGDVDRLRAAGESLRHDHPKLPFLLSGPWPLEAFADDHQ